ncbi:MAG: PilZ domain-containing protein [Planctomycetota bacterium]|jgi:hypothetical protein
MRSAAPRNYFATRSRPSAAADDGDRRRTGRVCPELLDCNLGRVADVSPGGIRVQRGRPLRGNRRVLLRREGDEGLLLFATVRWSRRIGFRRHEVGLAFVEPHGDDAAILRDLALSS